MSSSRIDSLSPTYCAVDDEGDDKTSKSLVSGHPGNGIITLEPEETALSPWRVAIICLESLINAFASGSKAV